jgi:hypothetical protein
LDRISGAASPKARCWDVFCWRENATFLFVEAKRSQRLWLAAAVSAGRPIEEFFIVEWLVDDSGTDSTFGKTTDLQVSSPYVLRFWRAFSAQPLRRREMQRRSPANRGEQAFGGNPTGASLASQISTSLPVRLGLWPRASCSSRAEGDVQELGRGFSMFEAFSDNTKGQGLDSGDSFIAARTVTHDAGQGGHFSQPAAIGLALKLDRKSQVGTVTFGPAA